MRFFNKLFRIVLIASFISCNQMYNSKSIVGNLQGNRFVFSRNLENQLDSIEFIRIILYVEDHTCASCMEKTLVPFYCLLEDSFPQIHPLLIIHNEKIRTENDVLNDHFRSVFRVLDTGYDSIRILNDWIPKGLAYYGFLLDDNDVVKASGFLSSKEFMNHCYTYLKEK